MGSSRDPGTRRILAVWLPFLPIDRMRRLGTIAALDKAPLIVAAKIDNALKLTAVDRNAARLNLIPGMALADARAMIPNLAVAEANEPADLKLLERIAEWCDRYTPFVALDPPHGLLFDVTGVAHLFGGERALLESIRASLKNHGFTIQAALAGTAVAARALAHYADGAIAAPGEESQAIASLPVAALNLDPAAVHGLRRAGLKTIGQVASRTRAELAHRFGKEMMATLDRAMARAEQPISPRRMLPDYMVEHRYSEPVVTEAVLIGSIFSLAKTLCGLLERRGEGARALQTVFFRADGVVRRISVETGRPLRDPSSIERLFRERIDALLDPLDPGFGFDLIRLEAVRAARLDPESIGLEETDDHEKEIAFLIDRLAARFGSHRVLSFQPQDTHIPEAEGILAPAQYARVSKLRWQKKENANELPRRPLRLFARAEPIEVVAEVPDGPPLRFRWRRAFHTIAHAEGPERIAMEWWRHQKPQPTRDYYRVEDTEGIRFWLYRDGLYGRETDRPRWYVHGLFA